MTVAQQQHADLVQQCLDGNAASYKKLYEQYARGMYNTSFRIVNNRAEAEDVLQESFIDAFNNLRSFENRSSFGAWLKQIVVHKSINYLKKKKLLLVEADENVADAYAAQAETDEQASVEWQVQQIRAGISQLPAGYRTVLSLYLLEGYDHEEIAQILGVAESTTRTQYIRAKQKLVTILKRGV